VSLHSDLIARLSRCCCCGGGGALGRAHPVLELGAALKLRSPNSANSSRPRTSRPTTWEKPISRASSARERAPNLPAAQQANHKCRLQYKCQAAKVQSLKLDRVASPKTIGFKLANASCCLANTLLARTWPRSIPELAQRVFASSVRLEGVQRRVSLSSG